VKQNQEKALREAVDQHQVIESSDVLLYFVKPLSTNMERSTIIATRLRFAVTMPGPDSATG
jgi:hypothetical protein